MVALIWVLGSITGPYFSGYFKEWHEDRKKRR